MQNNLTRFRISEGLSLQGLSDICGVTKSHIHTLEKQDASSPTLATAYAISSVLDKTVYEIWPNTVEIVEQTILVRRIKT